MHQRDEWIRRAGMVKADEIGAGRRGGAESASKFRSDRNIVRLGEAYR